MGGLDLNESMRNSSSAHVSGIIQGSCEALQKEDVDGNLGTARRVVAFAYDVQEA